MNEALPGFRRSKSSDDNVTRGCRRGKAGASCEKAAPVFRDNDAFSKTRSMMPASI
jgi:hypothetical protein